MKRLRASVTCVAAVVAAASFALAQSPLQPVQYVNPSSTLQEIQQALDNGGTVFFQYGEYNQILSSTPDLPPSPANPAKSLAIGRNGKDVNVIGLLSPNGQRPRINGGNVVFRVGSVGKAVNFRIENLEIFNPGLAEAGLLYSRVGIFVANALGSESVIHNCNITVNGKTTDMGAAMSHSAGIWFWLAASAQSLASGARIEITSNEITGAEVSAGVVLGQFRYETPSYMPPSLLIDSNVIDVSRLRGYGGSGAAVFLAGGWPNSAVTHNILRGDARFPGFKSMAIDYARSGELTSSNITVAGNDSSGFIGDIQLYLDRIVSGGSVTGNAFGPAGVAGAMSYGRESSFKDNHFYGPYPGWEPAGGGLGLFWFANTKVSTSQGNTLVATKLNGPPYGFDECTQVFDETDDPGTPAYDGANKFPGIKKCANKTDAFIQRMKDRKADIEAQLGEYVCPVIWPD